MPCWSKFNSSGVRQWGTYFGGEFQDSGTGISLDNTGNIYLTGATRSASNIATPGSQQPNLSVGDDAYLAKFNSTGQRIWATYYGGTNNSEFGSDCVTNAAGDTYMCGPTSSTVGIATPGSHQPVYGGGPTAAGDAYLTKFNSSGVLQWGTYYGGTGSEFFNRLTLDATGDVLAVGYSSSNNGTAIATPGSHQTTIGGQYDAILVRFNSNGVRQWGTYYGGTGQDYGGSASIDPSGNIFLSGDGGTVGGTSIATPCSYQPALGGGGNDAYLVKFTSNGRRIWGTYYGGNYTDYCFACSGDGFGNIYLLGLTNGNSTFSLATAGAFQTTYGGGNADAFVVKFDGCLPGSSANTTPLSKLFVCSGTSASLSATCGNWYATAISTNTLSTSSNFTTGPISSDTTFYVEEFGCGTSNGTRTAVSLTVVASPTLSFSNSDPGACAGVNIILTASGADSYTWANTSATTAAIAQQPLVSTNYTVFGASLNGCKTTATLTVNPNLCLGLDEHGVSKSIAVFPNPSSGQLTITSLSEQNFVLTNELGQSIQTIKLSAANNFNVQLSELPNGIYFLSGKNNDVMITQKIVVLH
jgi:hypothetical protein